MPSRIAAGSRDTPALTLSSHLSISSRVIPSFVESALIRDRLDAIAAQLHQVGGILLPFVRLLPEANRLLPADRRVAPVVDERVDLVIADPAIGANTMGALGEGLGRAVEDESTTQRQQYDRHDGVCDVADSERRLHSP